MKIHSATFLISAPDLRACPESDLSEYAFIGRSNVGKSSMINLLTGKKDLAKVSGRPGFTKLINFFTINDTWSLVDLPGYGYASVAKSQRVLFHEAIADYLQHRPNLKCTFVLIDSRIPPQRIDLDFLAWLTAEGIPFVLVFTKIDKLKRNAVETAVAKFLDALAETCGAAPQCFTSSAVSRAGRAEILAFIGDSLPG